MNSISKGLICLLKGLGLIILFGFVLESVVNDETHILLLITGIFTLFFSGCVENIVEQSK